MEFNCPTCQTKLRVADEQRNSRVRCRACGTIFRPLESGGSSRPPIHSPGSSAAPPGSSFSGGSGSSASSFEAAPKPGRDRFSAPDSPAPPSSRPVITPRAESTSRSSSRGGKGGWGIIFFIILMLLSRGPRLLRNFNRQPAPPPPVQIDHDEVMRRLRQQIDETKSDEEDNLPELPAAVDSIDVDLDGDGEAP